MIDRIAQLRAEGEAAIADAADSEALEDVRVRYLGRKAELPNMLRGVAQLPPEERGQVGRAANEARKGLEALVDERTRAFEAAELRVAGVDERLERDARLVGGLAGRAALLRRQVAHAPQQVGQLGLAP